ncbi:MAG: metal ABC transporter permease [Rhodospirillaceae bacterium]
MTVYGFIYTALIEPFSEYAFMRRALVGCLALAVGCGPIGVLLMLRRMSLMADAMSHAILPGAAVAFLWAGLSLPAMGVGGFFAGLVVALLAGGVARLTPLREDASFAAFYLISLAIGVLLVSARGNNVDLLHVLFGTILAVDDDSLVLMAMVATVSLAGLAVLYRPLVVECFDPGFLRSVDGGGGLAHHGFLVLVVLNLVAGFQALGTLMAVGLMMLPAAAARFWASELWALSLLAAVLAFASGYFGLVLSYHANLPSGPSIVLTAGLIYGVSVLVGPRGSLRARFLPGRHRAA